MTQYVYIMRAGKAYKIGRSGNPSARLKQITESALLRFGERPEIVHLLTINNPIGAELGCAQEAERRLHVFCDRWREHGEWFLLPQHIVDFICQQHNHAEILENMHAYVNAMPAGSRTQYATTREVAKLLEVDENDVIYWTKRGVIRYLKIDGVRLIAPKEIERVRALLDGRWI